MAPPPPPMRTAAPLSNGAAVGVHLGPGQEGPSSITSRAAGPEGAITNCASREPLSGTNLRKSLTQRTLYLQAPILSRPESEGEREKRGKKEQGNKLGRPPHCPRAGAAPWAPRAWSPLVGRSRTCPVSRPLAQRKAPVARRAAGAKEAGELGFEPRLTDPESVVLPLHYSPVVPAFRGRTACPAPTSLYSRRRRSQGSFRPAGKAHKAPAGGWAWPRAGRICQSPQEG